MKNDFDPSEDARRNYEVAIAEMRKRFIAERIAKLEPHEIVAAARAARTRHIATTLRRWFA